MIDYSECTTNSNQSSADKLTLEDVKRAVKQLKENKAPEVYVETSKKGWEQLKVDFKIPDSALNEDKEKMKFYCLGFGLTVKIVPYLKRTRMVQIQP